MLTGPVIAFAMLIAAVFCLLIALLIDVGVFGGNAAAWLAGGLFAYVVHHVFRVPPPGPPQ